MRESLVVGRDSGSPSLIWHCVGHFALPTRDAAPDDLWKSLSTLGGPLWPIGDVPRASVSCCASLPPRSLRRHRACRVRRSTSRARRAHPGVEPPSEPSAIPSHDDDNFGDHRDCRVEKGYAVAASDSCENGWAIENAVQRTHQLKALFTSKVR